MLDKLNGRIAYAMMSFGGFLRMGEEYRALPWSALRRDEKLDAYELNVSDDQLRDAPGRCPGLFSTPVLPIGGAALRFFFVRAFVPREPIGPLIYSLLYA
jgi:hypothetical protein